MTNYQIPQDAMLKYRFYNEFLMANERHVAKEVRDEYVETMSKMYYSYFKSYYSKLMKLQVRLFNSVHAEFLQRLDHCGLVMLYVIMSLSQYWFR